MIYDDIKELSGYRGLHPNLDRALEAIDGLSFDGLEKGRHEIDGDKAFFIIQENVLDKTPKAPCEIHRDYLDLHLGIEGEECIVYGFGNREVEVPYNAANEASMEYCERELALAVDKDHFAVFFPGEAHRPNVYAGGSERVRKCVVKVLID